MQEQLIDRQLLEMAANAARIPLDGWNDGLEPYSSGVGFIVPSGRLWNPLTSDGDALQLAAQLRLRVLPGKHPGDGCTVESPQDGIAGCTAFYDDPAKQMRVAIVRVAAEMGKA